MTDGVEVGGIVNYLVGILMVILGYKLFPMMMVLGIMIIVFSGVAQVIESNKRKQERVESHK